MESTFMCTGVCQAKELYNNISLCIAEYTAFPWQPPYPGVCFSAGNPETSSRWQLVHSCWDYNVGRHVEAPQDCLTSYSKCTYRKHSQPL